MVLLSSIMIFSGVEANVPFNSGCRKLAFLRPSHSSLAFRGSESSPQSGGSSGNLRSPAATRTSPPPIAQQHRGTLGPEVLLGEIYSD